MMDQVIKIIADALYVDVDQVTAETNLMKDLGAESIDFLDIVFRLEKAFSIKIPKGDIERRAQGNLSADEFAVNGRITDRGLESLRAAMPECDPAEIRAGLNVRDIPTLFRVSTFTRMVEQQLNTRTAPAASISAQPATVH